MQNSQPTYKVYSAGPLFTQHDLSSNVFLKRAVWEGSNGKFELVLPQSKEAREPEKEDVATFIRNHDLLQVVKSDLVLARFDGVELDPGTVVEFMMAKFLGKGALILRSDSRRQGGDSFDEPYNLMVKNWPRTVEVHADALVDNYQLVLDSRAGKNDITGYEKEIDMEMQIAEKGFVQLAKEIIKGFEELLLLPSPYPPEYQKELYRQARFMLGESFGKLLTEEKLRAILAELSDKGVL